MKSKFLLTLYLLISMEATSQEKFESPIVNGVTFSTYFQKSLIKKFYGKIDTLGINGVCFIKFQPTPDGKLKNVEFSPGTHPLLKEGFLEVLMCTNGLWKSKNFDSYGQVERWIVLPVRYVLTGKEKNTTVLLEPVRYQEFLNPTNYDKQKQIIFLPCLIYLTPFTSANSK